MEFICKYTGIGNLDLYYFFSIVILKYTNFCSSLVSELLLTDNSCQQKKLLAKIRQLHANKPKSLREQQVPEHFP